MFTDEHRRIVWDQIRQHDLRAFAKWMSPELLTTAAAEAGVRIGAGPLSVVNLAWLAVAAALHTSKRFADVLTLTLKLLVDSGGFAGTPLGAVRSRARRCRGPRRRSRHDPRRREGSVVSEEAFTKARRVLSPDYWRVLLRLLGERFEAAQGRVLYWKRFRLLALDGTEIKLPRWKRLAAYFGTANNGRGKRTPQARLVMLQFPLVRIPYRYELSPRQVGEKTLAGRLIEALRPKDLLLLDRGFWSYGLFWQIQKRKAFFGIRRFETATLKTLRRLGPQDRLVRYTPTGRQWRKQGLPRSMELRVIAYQVKGFRPSAVVTNVLDPQVTTRADWVRLAAAREAGGRLEPGLYHRRWEIETTFFELKISQGMKNSLRSRTPEGIDYEVAGHVLFYFLLRWLMVEAARVHGQKPLRLSFRQALRELQDLNQTLLTASAQRVSRVLLPRLLARIADHVVARRPGRHYARPHDTKTKNKGHGKLKRPSKLPTAPPPRANKKKRAA
jgi:hypothetical protein